jgi:sortase A
MILFYLMLAGIGAIFLADGLWIKAKAQLAQWLIASAWSHSVEQQDHGVKGHLLNSDSLRPWPWADTWPVARLEVPRLQIEQYVMAGLSGQALAFGPAMELSDQTSGGWMVAGHKDTHFDFLRQLQVGDIVRLTLQDGVTYQFQVSEQQVLDLNLVGESLQVPDNELALVTCYPFGLSESDSSLRYLVSADLASVQQLTF